MVDGNWYTQSMEEGVNQGCPLSYILAALVLHEVLAPINAKLTARAFVRYHNNDKGDDGHGGQTHIMGYIDDVGTAIPHADSFFFCREFERTGPALGCHLNRSKTRILASTNGESALPSIVRDFGPAAAAELRQAIATFSVEEVPSEDPTTQPPAAPTFRPKEVVKGLRLLGQPLGSLQYARSFFEARLKENEADATNLLLAVSDQHTALRLFSQCTLHKLPHLLGSEVMYRFRESSYEHWD